MNDSDRRSHAPTPEPAPDSPIRTARIQLLNDLFRLTGLGGRQVFTSGIRNLGLVAMIDLRMAVAEYDRFTPDSDPFGEHDFGMLEFQGATVFWKIDYYDETLTWASPDPADPVLTRRVLTIMLASEY